MAHVFLDPDGSVSVFGVIVRGSTGVVYAHQCAGLRTDIRREEGFFVPIAERDASSETAQSLHQALATLFEELRGHPPADGKDLSDEFRERVSVIVGRIPFWKTTEDERDERVYLALDRTRDSEITEAWVPVMTPYGAGVLVFENSD